MVQRDAEYQCLMTAYLLHGSVSTTRQGWRGKCNDQESHTGLLSEGFASDE
jgi:hypothetical protein